MATIQAASVVEAGASSFHWFRIRLADLSSRLLWRAYIRPAFRARGRFSHLLTRPLRGYATPARLITLGVRPSSRR